MYGYSEEEYKELSNLSMVINNLQDAQSHLNLTMYYIDKVKNGTFNDRFKKLAKDLDQLLMDVGEVYLAKKSKD